MHSLPVERKVRAPGAASSVAIATLPLQLYCFLNRQQKGRQSFSPLQCGGPVLCQGPLHLSNSTRTGNKYENKQVISTDTYMVKVLHLVMCCGLHGARYASFHQSVDLMLQF